MIFGLILYYRSSNAKKFRHGMEYGSAKWGSRKDILPFMDPVFSSYNPYKHRIPYHGENSKETKIPGRNKNVIVIGGSSGRTRHFVMPNLMQMHSVCPFRSEGEILATCGKMLKRIPKKDINGEVVTDM